MQLDRLARAQTPLLNNLRGAAPHLARLSGNLPAFNRNSEDALRTLGKAGVVGKRALQSGADEIELLAEAGRKATPTLEPLGDFLTDIDDPRRAVEIDERAGEDTGRTGLEPGRRNTMGYTGLEGLLNYVRNQTLAINQFDGVSHLFRFGIYEANTGLCGSFSSGRDPDTGEIGVPAQAGGTTTSMLDAADCIAWLGANQGGIAPGHQDEDLGLPQYHPSACPNGTLPMDAATRYCDGVARRDGDGDGRDGGGGPDRKRGRPAGDTDARASFVARPGAGPARRPRPAGHRRRRSDLPRRRWAWRLRRWRRRLPGGDRRPPRLPLQAMRRNATSVLAASPTMVGAVTVLVAIVAVFLAYNANKGLPFVPVYRVSVEIPNGARATNANEIRIGGTRVGVIESIEPIVDSSGGQTVSVDSGSEELPQVAARLNLKLDEAAKPLPVDSVFRVRYRSAFGLKYLEVVRGTGEPAEEGYIFDGLDDGAVCDLPTEEDGQFAADRDPAAANGCFQAQDEFDDLGNTYDRKTRMAQRDNLEGFGSAFAGRGLSLNDTIQELGPLMRYLGPVARNLSDPETRFNRLFPALARTASLVQPVASLQAEQFAFAARAFEAISRDPDAYATVIEQGPETLRTAISLLPAQREFNRKFADLAIELNPGIEDLRTAAPALNEAVEVGTPVLGDQPPVNRRLRSALRGPQPARPAAVDPDHADAPARDVRRGDPARPPRRSRADGVQLLELLVHVLPERAVRRGAAPRQRLPPDAHALPRRADGGDAARRLLGPARERQVRPGGPGRQRHVQAIRAASLQLPPLRADGPGRKRPRLPARADRIPARLPGRARAAALGPGESRL